MINIIWVTRPKRKLNSIPEVLATVSDIALDQEWTGQRNNHLSLEESLEKAGLKRIGDRRDQSGGGGRTYFAWLKSLGLIFKQAETGKVKLTLAGEEILSGYPPVAILKRQVVRYQFPSPFSISRGVDVSPRFKVHPFWLLLKLMKDNRLSFYLTQEEIAKIFIEEADSDSDVCYDHLVYRILQFRQEGDKCLDKFFFEKYLSGRSNSTGAGFVPLLDVANTMINWLDYTQLIYRYEQRIYILPEREQEVDQIISHQLPFINRPEDEEFFQRKYGIGLYHNKDIRNLNQHANVTLSSIAEHRIRNLFISKAASMPIFEITPELISNIADESGYSIDLVATTLQKKFPHGSINSFMSEYFEMAFKGRDEATEFEKATAKIFEKVFHFDSYHVGPIGLTPDIEISSPNDKYQAIIDNKAYSTYSINNDHHNRMVINYINGIQKYQKSPFPLAFFSYIAGGLGKNIDAQIQSIAHETGVNGSAIPVCNFIKMIELNQITPYSHEQIRRIFSINRRIRLSDL